MVILNLSTEQCESIQRALIASDEPAADVIHDLIGAAVAQHDAAPPTAFITGGDCPGCRAATIGANGVVHTCGVW